MRGASCWLLAATFSLFFSSSASAIFTVTADGYEFFNDLNVNNPMVLSYPVTIVRAIGGFSYHQQSISETGGSRVMRKTATGALFLSGHDNTYSGGTIISEGVLNWDRDRAFGIAGTGITIDDRAVLGWENGSFATSRPFTLSGGFATLRAAGGVTGTVNGTISGAGALVAGSAGYLGTIVLGVNNSYQGGTIANVGTLQISSDSNLGQAGTAVTINDAVLEANGTFITARQIALNNLNSRIGVTSSGQTLTLSGVVGGTGRLNKTGGGTLVLTNSNSYQGGTTVTSGTLQVSSDANLGDAAGGVTLNGGTLATTTSFDTNRTFTLLSGAGGIAPAAGTTLTLNGQVTGVGTLNHIGAGNLILAGNSNYSGGTFINGGTLEVRDGSSLGTGNVGSSGTLLFNHANAMTIGNFISGNGALTKTGAGTLTLAASNNYTGVTTVNAGTLVVGNAAALGTSAGGTTVNSGATLLITGSSPTLVLADALTISGTGNGGIGAIRVEPNANPGNQAANLSGGITLTADAAITLTDRMVWLFTGPGIGLGSSTLTFNSEGTGTSTTRVNSAISGTGGLIKNGPGLLELNVVNTFTGPVMLNDGTALLSGGSALADTVAVTMANAVILDVNASETIGSLAGTGRVILRDGVTLTTGADNTSTTFTGTSPNGIVGTGGLNKVGTGTFTLTGINSYSGGTTVAAGTLLVTGSVTSLVTVNDTGTAGGSGTLGGGVVVNAGGHLAPGLSATTGI